MVEKYSDFEAFLAAMSGKSLLHIGHKDADCDALGSAYAMSRLLPGDIGFALELKAQAQSVATWLDLKWIKNPNPADYDFTIIYDTAGPGMLGVPMPAHYAIFDHHESGGHRFSVISNELSAMAEWGWVLPVESTCSLIIDLLQEHAIPIDQKMAVALAAGIVTDTARLQHAHAPALHRLAIALQAANMHVEDVWAVIEPKNIRAVRRPAVLHSLRNIQESTQQGWSILSTEIDSHDNAFVVMDALIQFGGDMVVVGFPKWGQSMVITAATAMLVEDTGIDLNGLMKVLAPTVNANEVWGTRVGGRIIAPIPVKELVVKCVQRAIEALED
ncbi:MAG: DHH family phosphoesterase [Anaerolineales bacterium]